MRTTGRNPLTLIALLLLLLVLFLGLFLGYRIGADAALRDNAADQAIRPEVVSQTGQTGQGSRSSAAS